jgi:hypothetical protein
MVHVFATEAKGLASKLSRPKKSSRVTTDLSDVVVRDIALKSGRNGTASITSR